MNPETWMLFALTEFVLSLTPGPAVLFVLSQGVSRGGAKSVWSSIGILAANAFYFGLSATGIGALILTSYQLFFAVKWIGAIYLLWLGIKAFIGKSQPILVADSPKTPVSRLVLNGFILQAANPKALLFFSALLPQFIDPSLPVASQILILGVTSILIEFLVLATYGLIAGRLVKLTHRSIYQSLSNRISSALLIAAGLGLAAVRRSTR
jgi:threonine/homoserine/homoserine lactone efflux protein